MAEPNTITWTAYNPNGYELSLTGRVDLAEVSVTVVEVRWDGKLLTDRSLVSLFDGGYGERDAENACDDWIVGQEFAKALGLDVS